MHPDMSFLSCAVHELENPKAMPEEFILHTSLFPKKHPVGWREKLSTTFLGFPLQPYGINNGLLMQHIAGMRDVVQQVCKGFPSLSLVQSRWTDLGYSEDSFEKFVVAALHLKLMEVHSTRLGYYVKPLGKYWGLEVSSSPFFDCKKRSARINRALLSTTDSGWV